MALGGYREKSGRSKQGHYKGIYCGSTYELCWAIHALDHNIGFSRFDKKLVKNGVVYYPDFILSDGKTIIEPKGYEPEESVSKKTALAESLGYIVKVMRKEDLQYAFDYVYETYGTKKYQTLYDNYKPKYTYVCANCNKQFSRDKKLKRTCNKAFCSKSCSGKFQVNANIKNGIPKKSNSGQFGQDGNTNASYDPPRKLTKEDALYIYYEEKKSLPTLAKEFNVSKNVIWFIKKKRSYLWIHDASTEKFIPKSYDSIQSYQTEKKNERLNMIKEILAKFKEQKMIFNTQVELATNVTNEILIHHSLEINSAIFRKQLDYRNLIKEYLQNQLNF